MKSDRIEDDTIKNITTSHRQMAYRYHDTIDLFFDPLESVDQLIYRLWDPTSKLSRPRGGKFNSTTITAATTPALASSAWDLLETPGVEHLRHIFTIHTEELWSIGRIE